MSIKQKIEAHATGYPCSGMSFYEMYNNREKWRQYGKWRVSHCLCGVKVPLKTPISHVTRRGALKPIKTITLRAIDLCGGIRFTSDKGYWVDIEKIDFEKLESGI